MRLATRRTERPVSLPPRVRGLLGYARPTKGPSRDELTPKLVLVAAIRVGVVSIALAVLLVATALNPPTDADVAATWQYGLIGATYGLSLIYAALLRKPRLALPLAYAQTVLDGLIVTVLVLMTGGAESVFSFAYVFAVLGASVTVYRKGAFTAAIASSAMFSGVVGLQLARALDALPPIDPRAAASSLLVQTVGLLLVAVLASRLAETARITGKRLAEKEVDYEQLQELHAAILRSLPAGLMTVDAEGVVRFANESARAILGRRIGQLVGHPLAEVVPSMTPAWNRVRASGYPDRRERFEEGYERPDGGNIRLGFSFAPLRVGAVIAPSGIVVFQDVTNIVRLKEAVERAERLATVGKFAAGLAHEVRNPLASMCASIDVLAQSLEVSDGTERLMRNVVKEAERLNGLITDFLAFAKPRKLHLKDTDLGDLVTGVLAMFENDALVRHCQIHRKLALGVRASVDEPLLRQVVWNLVRNAAEAMRPAGGTLWVETKMEDRHPTLVVRDTGPGISPERLRRVFDPFYTTKEGGSGLGLAITHSIVEAHGAEIGIDSRDGEGTQVRIRFSRDRREVSLSLPPLTDSGVVKTDDLELPQPPVAAQSAVET